MRISSKNAKILPHIKRVIASSVAKFIIVSDSTLDEFVDCLIGIIKGSKKTSIYSNIETKKILIQKQDARSAECMSVPKIEFNDAIESISVRELSKEQFSRLKALYMSKKIKSKSLPHVCYGLFSGENAIPLWV